jgi:L,D-peptidoglycan transpeptidase YkuD (ErfK/YbiS/YcfS/YnhG family)
MIQHAIPGVGRWMMSQIPAATHQVVLVTGPDRSANRNTVTLWQRTDASAPWARFGVSFTGRNGADGWTTSHQEGDLHSPIGAFTLTAAGGKLADPGTAMPYEYQPHFYLAGDGDQDDPLTEAFNYVVAIDYNRVPGRPPSDPTRPLGAAAGGDIWIHVDHASATKACVSLPRDVMVALLRWLQPSSQPMILMGDAGSVAGATPDQP